MAQTNQLTGSQIAKFSNVEVHRYLKKITDTRGPRRVEHNFPYRDGAKQETLGRKPHRTEWLLTYTGPTWIADFLQLADAIDSSPSGILVHPIYGQMNVVCDGFDRATVDVVEALDTIDVPLVFLEDQLDLGLTQQATVASAQQQVVSDGQNLQAQAAAYTSAILAAQTMVDLATGYAAAAFAAVTSAIADPTLPQQLDSVGSSCVALEAAILADPAAQGSALSYDALAAAEVLYTDCLLMADIVAQQTIGFVQYVVPGDSSLAVILQAQFGAQAINYYDQTLRLNPTLLDPTSVPAGFQLVLPVQQGA